MALCAKPLISLPRGVGSLEAPRGLVVTLSLARVVDVTVVTTRGFTGVFFVVDLVTVLEGAKAIEVLVPLRVERRPLVTGGPGVGTGVPFGVEGLLGGVGLGRVLSPSSPDPSREAVFPYMVG